MYQKSEPETIQALFAGIAKNYDRANALFTFGLHKRWNQALIEKMKGTSNLLDLCAGTGDIGLGFLKQNARSKAILLDFCPQMLGIAQKKGFDCKERFAILQADAQALPLPNHSVDGVSIAYGIRNVQEPAKCFQEVFRVLTHGGKFGILEATRPTWRWMRAGHKLYTKLVLPTLGKWAARDKKAYQYLANSVEAFEAPTVLKETLLTAGFSSVTVQPLFGGVVTLFTACK